MNKIPFIIAVLVLPACGLMASFKLQDAFALESMSAGAFKEELPFQEINNMIVIQAEFQGQKGDFIFDTGATTQVDNKFAASLELEKIGKVKTFDSNRTKRYVPYTKLDEMKIGDVSFHDMVVSISDLEALNTAACMQVSGIIGANAMNKCVWQIDYKNKKIILTSSRDSLQFSGKEQQINFDAQGKGTPTIALYADGQYWGDAIFDTGSNGGLAVDEKYINGTHNFIEGQYCNYAVHSEEIRSLKLASIADVQLNNSFALKDQLVSFSKNMPFGIIGNKLLKNYVLTIDWHYQQVLLDAYETKPLSTHGAFGFYPRFVQDQLVVGSILLASEIAEKGLKLNDKIISINHLNFKEDVYTNYCKYLEQRRSWDRIELSIEREGEILEFSLGKENILDLIEQNRH